MRKIVIVAFLVLLANVAFGATSLTGTLMSPLGGTAQGTLYLTPPLGTTVTAACGGGPGIAGPTGVITIVVAADGTLTNPPVITGNDCLLPLSTSYSVRFVDSNSNTYYGAWQITGATFDVGTQVVGASGTVQTLPTQSQTVAQPPSTVLTINRFSVPTSLQAPGIVGAPTGACTNDSVVIQRNAAAAKKLWVCVAGVWEQQGVSGAGGGNLLAINTDVTGNQTIALGTTGTAPNIVDNLTGTHTIHLPYAGTAGVTRGLLSKTDWDLFSTVANKQPLDQDLTDIGALTRTRGGLIVGGASAWTYLPIGAANRLLISDGTDANWTALSSGLVTTALGFTPIDAATKNAASGVAGLTAGTKLTAAQGQEVWAIADLSDVTAKQGNATVVMMAGTVSGTAAALCTDANGNATTVGCGAGAGDMLLGTAQTSTAKKTFSPTASAAAAAITCAALPSTPVNGDMACDSADSNQFKVRSNGSWITVGSGGGISALTGDVTASGTGSVAATLANTAVSPGSCGDTTHSCSVTVDSKGRLTAMSNNVISGAGGIATDITTTTVSGLPGTYAVGGIRQVTDATVSAGGWPYYITRVANTWEQLGYVAGGLGALSSSCTNLPCTIEVTNIVMLKTGTNAVTGTLDVTGASSTAGFYTTVKDEGTTLTKRNSLKFTGGGVTCTDSSPDTVCDIPLGSGAGDMLLGTAQTSTAKKTFSPTSTVAGLAMTCAALPSSPVNGDLACDSGDSNKIKLRSNGAWVDPATGSSVTSSNGAANRIAVFDTATNLNGLMGNQFSWNGNNFVVAGSIQATFGGNGGTSDCATTTTFPDTLASTVRIRLTGNCTASSSGFIHAGIVTVQVCQDATGSRTFAWPAEYSGGPVIASTALSCTVGQFQGDSVLSKWWATSTAGAGGITALTGDVTASGSGSVAATLANVPSGTPHAGSALFTAIAAPGTPASGKGSVYVDATSKNLVVKDDAGVVKHGVQTDTGTANNYISAISDAGAITKSRPACATLSDSAGGCSMSTTAGGDLSGTFPNPALANIPTATPMAGSLLATAITAPGTPASGKGSIYVDSTSKNIAVKDDAGVVKHGVQTDTGAANNYISAISDAGAITKSRPACATLSDSGTACTAVAPANTTATGSQWFTAYTAATGAFTKAQPAFTDISGSVTDAQVPDTITASNYMPLAGGTMTGQLVAANLGIEFTESDTNPTCAAGNYSIFADLSETKLKKCTNGTVTDLGAGTGTVAGSDTQVQFNDGGVVGASSAFTFNKTTNVLTVGSAVTTGGSETLGNATGDTAASFFEANSGDAASNGEPAYIKLWSSHTTKRKASLFPCTDADGIFCIATGTPAADGTATIMTASVNGLLSRTAAGTATGRTLTAPAAGITVTNGDGVSGNPTLVLANDLLAVEGLSANGIAVRTATDTWTVRTITGGAGISVSNGDGVAGAPTISAALNTLVNSQTMFDGSQASRTITFDLSGTDPVLTLSSGAFNISTGTIQQGGTAVVLTSRTLTGGAGIAVIGDLSADRTISVDSTEQGFISSGALTCGASTNGKMQVHTTPLQYCDNAGTPVLQYAAYGDSAGRATAGDSATAFFTTGQIEAARGGTNIDSSGSTGIPHVSSGTWTVSALVDSDVPDTITLTNLTQITTRQASDLTYTDDVRITFNPGATVAGINVGSQAGDPSTPINGDIWYDSTGNNLRARINGATLSLGAGGGVGCVPSGSAGQLLYDSGVTTCSSMADFVFASNTITGGASSKFDISAASVTAGLKIPSAAGAAPTGDGFLAINTTNHTFTHGSNGTTLVGAVAATGTGTATTCSSQAVTAVSAIAVPTCTTLTSAYLDTSVVRQNNTNTAGSSMTLDLTSVSATAGFKVPGAAGAAPTADGAFAFDTTAHAFVGGYNGTKRQMATLDGTETLLGKTYNVESTGNVFTAPSVVVLWAGGCQNTTALSYWDLPTSTPAVATCVTGTNIQKGVLAYADTAGGFSAQSSFAFPADWTTATLPDVDIYWTTTATSGNAIWTVQFVCTDVAASATDDPAFPTSGNGFNKSSATAAPGTASRVQTTTITAVTLPSSCVTATKELIHVRLFRDGNDGSDTIGATANFLGMIITPRRAM